MQRTVKSFAAMAREIAAIDRQKAESLRRGRPLAKARPKTTPGPRIAR